jgi:hypothetical protein
MAVETGRKRWCDWGMTPSDDLRDWMRVGGEIIGSPVNREPLQFWNCVSALADPVVIQVFLKN